VNRVWTRTGTAEVATDPMGMEVSDIFIALKPRANWKRAANQEQLTELMRKELAVLPGIRVEGLMTMAPFVTDETLIRPVFRGLRDLRDELAATTPAINWRHLSMGMTNDFEIAIEEGATIVRVGSAIFGARNRE
jgi:uncharacterized pyridoxal phosphate-containing UPF0001 family protein